MGRDKLDTSIFVIGVVIGIAGTVIYWQLCEDAKAFEGVSA